MKTFKQFLDESTKIQRFLGTNKKQLPTNSTYEIEVVFKSFVDELSAKKLLDDAGITGYYFKQVSTPTGLSIAGVVDDATDIKPNKLQGIKNHPFVIRAIRFKNK